MKPKTFWTLAFVLALGVLVNQTACTRPSSTTAPAPTTPSGGGGGSTPTPSGPTTITISVGSSSSSSTGYVYTATTGSNGSTGLLSLTAHVGDSIVLPGSGYHPLYFDAGSSTCIYTGSTSTQTYTFPSAGTYYFHCGNHATGCSAGNGACGSTNCTSMAGVVTVS